MRDIEITPLALTEECNLIESSFFNLDAKKFNEFNAMLDTPPSENQGLALLMAVKAPWGADNE